MSEMVVNVNVSAAQPIRPGEMYVLECADSITSEVASEILKVWEDRTGAKAVLLANGVRLALCEPEVRS